MENKKLFDRTVSILSKAYLNDTLRHGDCYACAVGNLVCHAIGSEFKNGIWTGSQKPQWDNVFMTALGEQDIIEQEYNGAAKLQIDSTGYSYLI